MRDTLTSGSDWLDLLRKAQQLNEVGKPQKAIDTALACAARFSSDIGASGWALYHVFRFRLEAGETDGAADVVEELLSLGSNLGSKLFAATVSIDHFTRTKQPERADAVALALDAAVGRWRDDPGNLLENLDIKGGTQAIYYALSTRIWPQLKHLRFHDIEDHSEIVAQVDPIPLPKPSPRLSNAVPEQILGYQGRQGLQQALSIRRVENAYFRKCGGYACAFDAAGQILPINYRRIPAFYKETLEETGRNRSEARAVSDQTLSVMDEFNNGLNFCHWLVDYIPRALVASEYIPFQSILGPAPISTDFQQYTLGGVLSRAAYIDMGSSAEGYAFSTLAYADNFGENLGHPLYDGSAKLIQLLKADLVRNLGRVDPIKLYVPRKFNRKVANNEELESLLEIHGFVSIDTDTLSLAEQIRLFSAATHIVGPHGAALTNIVFSRRGAHILELFPRWGGSPAFYVISCALGHDYSCFVDLTMGPPTSSSAFMNVANMRVDLAFVESWLQETAINKPS